MGLNLFPSNFQEFQLQYWKFYMFFISLLRVFTKNFELIGSMDQSPINQNFDLNKSRQNFITAWKSVTKLQHFATKLITNIVMLFQAVMKFLSRLAEFKIVVNWGLAHSSRDTAVLKNKSADVSIIFERLHELLYTKFS